MDTVGKGGRKHLVVREQVTPKPENGWMVSISVWHKRETKCSKCDLMVIQRWSLGVQILLVTAVRTRHKVTHFHTDTNLTRKPLGERRRTSRYLDRELFHSCRLFNAYITTVPGNQYKCIYSSGRDEAETIQHRVLILLDRTFADELAANSRSDFLNRGMSLGSLQPAD